MEDQKHLEKQVIDAASQHNKEAEGQQIRMHEPFAPQQHSQARRVDTSRLRADMSDNDSQFPAPFARSKTSTPLSIWER
ncbi:hypothetical protein GCM10007898_37500 [Dyella flagellata]|uniref:Uncharacterized protein n=1 Tax=Dyella flagellata TaxID=1867833 RepID=A0ABQ5XES1_9GAMM|nr:hypothetical protein GCM10007898_37500 [Dyella flagellata]